MVPTHHGKVKTACFVTVYGFFIYPISFLISFILHNLFLIASAQKHENCYIMVDGMYSSYIGQSTSSESGALNVCNYG